MAFYKNTFSSFKEVEKFLTESKCESDFAILSCTNGDRLGREPDHDEPKYHPHQPNRSTVSGLTSKLPGKASRILKLSG